MISRRWWVIVREGVVLGHAPGVSPRRAVDAWLAGEGLVTGVLPEPVTDEWVKGVWAESPSETHGGVRPVRSVSLVELRGAPA